MANASANPGRGIKHDSDKPMVHLLEPEFLLGMASIMTFGAKKYGENNWKQGIEMTRLYSAAMRHLLAFHSGQEFDPESGQSHLYHASCNLMMLDHYMRLERAP
jgi:hypothetical protein